MATQIKITQLTDIGSANLAVTTLLPVVNMAGLPTTQKTTLGNLANVILSQSGGNFAPVATANIAYSVANAAQPNITSLGTLTNVAVSGNVTVNGNITSNGTAYVGNLSTTGLASITTLNVGATANLGAVGNVTITGGSAGQKLTTNGSGVLTWTDDANSSYGNSNVANFLPTLSSANVGAVGGGQGVTNLNLAGNIVANPGYMNIVWDSYTMYFNQSGKVVLNANLEVNANVSNANVITANYFRGDGSNLTNVVGNTGDINFNGANISTNTQNANISINGYGPNAHVVITSNNEAWTFEPYGTLDFPDGSRIGRTDGNNAIGIDVFTGDKFVIQTEDSSNNVYSWQFTPLGALIVPDQNPGQASIISYSGGNVNVASFISFVTPDSSNLVLGTTGNNHVVINTDKANANVRWSFDDTGNLTLPGNTFAVKYANGVQVSIGGGSNTGNVTFSNVTVQGDNNGLNLSAGADFTANLAYLQVRAGDVASHIHLDTGNNEAYDLIVGDDQNYVQVSSTGNILLSSYDSNTAQYTWTLDYNGNLILAGGNSVIQSIANSSLDPTLPNVSTMVLTPDANYNSQVLVLDPTAPGHIHLRAYAFSNIDEPAANIFLGGEDTAFEITSGANNQAVIHSNGKAWTFGNDGNISSDTLTFTTTFANVKTVEYQTAGVWDLYVEDGITGSNTASSRLNVSFKDNLIDKPQVYIENTKESDGIALRWTFDENGNLNFPRDVAGNSDPYLSIFGGSTPTIQSTDVSLAGPANLAIQSNYLNLSGFSGDKIVFYADTGEMATDANMTLTTNLANTGNTSSWTFSDDGLLTLPGGNVVIGSLLGSEAILASNIAFGVVSQGNGSTVLQWIDDVSNASALSAIYINSPSGNTGDVVVLTGEPGANANIWTFGNNGNLTLPTGGQIIVSGGLVSSGASPAPTINGFSISNSMGISGNGNISTTGTITSTGKIGYSTGGNATQASTGAGVTINQLTGLVTLANRTYNAGDLEAFSISCNKVSNDDFVLVQMVDSVNAPSYNVVAYPNFVLANTISVLVKTLETVGTDTPILKFMIVKAPTA